MFVLHLAQTLGEFVIRWPAEVNRATSCALVQILLEWCFFVYIDNPASCDQLLLFMTQFHARPEMGLSGSMMADDVRLQTDSH